MWASRPMRIIRVKPEECTRPVRSRTVDRPSARPIRTSADGSWWRSRFIALRTGIVLSEYRVTTALATVTCALAPAYTLRWHLGHHRGVSCGNSCAAGPPGVANWLASPRGSVLDRRRDLRGRGTRPPGRARALPGLLHRADGVRFRAHQR